MIGEKAYVIFEFTVRHKRYSRTVRISSIEKLKDVVTSAVKEIGLWSRHDLVINRRMVLVDKENRLNPLTECNRKLEYYEFTALIRGEIDVRDIDFKMACAMRDAFYNEYHLRKRQIEAAKVPDVKERVKVIEVGSKYLIGRKILIGREWQTVENTWLMSGRLEIATTESDKTMIVDVTEGINLKVED